MEAAWIRALAQEADLVVPAVIAPPDGDPFIVEDAEGRPRGVLILTWLPGRKMRWRFAAHHARALGAAAAVLHRNAQSFVPPTEGWAKSWSADALIGSGDRHVIIDVVGIRAVSIIDRVHARLAAAFDDLGTDDWTLVNGDLGPHNVVWDSQRPGLFDFNDLGWGYTGFDLARYLRGLRWRSRGEQLVEAALDGYQSVAPLPNSFQRYGSLFEAAAGLFLAHYLAGQIDKRGDDAIRAIRDVVSFADT
jgi:Ser/Thr protein kinase RdoA (MazF antagonist)